MLAAMDDGIGHSKGTADAGRVPTAMAMRAPMTTRAMPVVLAANRAWTSEEYDLFRIIFLIT
jgi:hypothetical protein